MIVGCEQGLTERGTSHRPMSILNGPLTGSRPAAGSRRSGAMAAKAANPRVSPLSWMAVLQFQGLKLLRCVTSETLIA